MADLTDSIVVGIDGSEEALNAATWAAVEAPSRDLALHLVSSTYVPGFYGLDVPQLPEMYEWIDHMSRTQLHDASERVRTIAPQVPVQTEYLRQPPIPLLLEMSKSAHMIALGASGRGGFSGMLLGSTAIAVTAHASCPVAVVRSASSPDGPVVVGADGSETSVAALRVAFSEASSRKARLVAVHVEEIPSIREVGLGRTRDRGHADRVLGESLAGWRSAYPDVSIEAVAETGQPSNALLDWSNHAQLIVVGTRGRGGFRGMLLGSTSQALLHHARCPVLVARNQAG